jgi:hypothetical protein
MGLWHDRRIAAGDYWNERIAVEIERSQVFVALVTNDFFHSNYIVDHELPAILKQHRDRGALVVPIIYRESCWRGFFGSYIQVLPSRDGRVRPVAEWRPTESGFAAAANGLQTAIEQWFGVKPSSPLATAGGAR